MIIESNSVMRFVRPDLYLSVLDPATEDFKSSAREYLDRADVVLVHAASEAAWKGVSLKPVADKPTFPVVPPQYVSPDLVEFVRNRVFSGPKVPS